MFRKQFVHAFGLVLAVLEKNVAQDASARMPPLVLAEGGELDEHGLEVYACGMMATHLDEVDPRRVQARGHALQGCIARRSLSSSRAKRVRLPLRRRFDRALHLVAQLEPAAPRSSLSFRRLELFEQVLLRVPCEDQPEAQMQRIAGEPSPPRDGLVQSPRDFPHPPVHLVHSKEPLLPVGPGICPGRCCWCRWCGWGGWCGWCCWSGCL
jgi:hypothetical protein